VQKKVCKKERVMGGKSGGSVDSVCVLFDFSFLIFFPAPHSPPICFAFGLLFTSVLWRANNWPALPLGSSIWAIDPDAD